MLFQRCGMSVFGVFVRESAAGSALTGGGDWWGSALTGGRDWWPKLCLYGGFRRDVLTPGVCEMYLKIGAAGLARPCCFSAAECPFLGCLCGSMPQGQCLQVLETGDRNCVCIVDSVVTFWHRVCAKCSSRSELLGWPGHAVSALRNVRFWGVCAGVCRGVSAYRWWRLVGVSAYRW